MVKKILIFMLCLIVVNLQAVTEERLFENDQLINSKIFISPNEKNVQFQNIPEQILIPLKGGIITYSSDDGQKVEVDLLEGNLYLGTDLGKKIYTNKDAELELLVIQMKNSQASHQADDYNIVVDIRIKCPLGEEYEEFVKSVPTAGRYSTPKEEWKASFAENITTLVELIKTGNFENDSYWSVITHEPSLSESKQPK